MGERTYRAGDVVRHLALGQEWLLACDEEHGRIAACGWPESWNRVEEVELVEEATDLVRLDRLRETAAMKGNDSRTEAARRQLAALASAEGPLDAIERRAKAMGFSVDRATLGRDEYLDVATSNGAHATYRTRDGVLSDHISTTGPVCSHDRALLERDCAALDLLRSLTLKANAAKAVLADMRREIEALQGLLGVSHG